MKTKQNAKPRNSSSGKKQAVKSLWDTRIQVARDYTGEADSDLNMHLTLPELEKDFLKHNPASADAFASAMQRTSFPAFKTALDKVLESGVSLETLAKERIAMATYANAIRDWRRADGWILSLIEAKKVKSEVEEPEDDEVDHASTQQAHEDRLKALPGEIRDYIPKWIKRKPCAIRKI